MVHSSVKKMGPTIHFWRRGVNYNVLLETTLVDFFKGCSNCRLLEVDVQTCFRHAELFGSPRRMGHELCNFRTMTHDTREVTFQYQRIF
jgi:hypothetical protein